MSLLWATCPLRRASCNFLGEGGVDFSLRLYCRSWQGVLRRARRDVQQFEQMRQRGDVPAHKGQQEQRVERHEDVKDEITRGQRGTLQAQLRRGPRPPTQAKAGYKPDP